MTHGQVVCIVGPTASGKTSLADALAQELASSVVSIDAMQVYKGMDIGTAKTPLSERPVPLLMVDVAPVDEDYSVKLFQRDARTCIDELRADHKLPVLCGGTGLYLNAVIDCMDFPAGSQADERRSKYVAFAAQEGPDALYDLLLQKDPQSAKLIHPHNVRRVIRALELHDEGSSYARTHEGLHRRKPYYDALIFGIRRKRDELYRRINQRVDLMFEQGLLDEVKSLLDRGLASTLTARQAIGYKELIDYLEGRCSLDEARETIAQRTRRYAKRQISWFEHDQRVSWLDFDTMGQDEALAIIREALQQKDFLL